MSTEIFEIDLTKARDKAAVLRAVAGALAFPPTFGHNWDALADHLEDLSWHPANGYVLSIRTAPSTQQALGADWAMLLDILDDAARYWRGRGKAFTVVLDGNALPQE